VAAESDDDLLLIAPEVAEPTAAADAAPWKVLVVDDDDQVHAITRLVLRHVRFRERPLLLLGAASAREAREMLRAQRDIAVALVDVVMETPQAGLELVRFIRSELKLRSIRLILRTGQPGRAPEQDVVIGYEIDDYKAKTEFSAQQLVTGVIASLRAYAYITEIERLNAELERRVAMRTAELEKLAMLDPLTGAGNRRHLNDRAAREMADRRAGDELSVVLFDLDHFKAINDRHGHAAGDAVLKRVVEIVKGVLRADDFLARTGGEEFVLLLPGQGVEAARADAARARATLATTVFEVGTERLSVTASFGVAVVGLDNLLEEVLPRADKALYGAKHSGRNRVVVAGD
jgi:diguanylate cyclase